MTGEAKPGDIRDDGAILTIGWGWRHRGEIWIDHSKAEQAKAHGWEIIDSDGILCRVMKP